MIIGAIKSLILQLQIVSCAIFDICIMSIVARGPCVLPSLFDYILVMKYDVFFKNIFYLNLKVAEQ